MTRRKKSTSETISLFPFLSILACVIGTLTLMIAGLAASQIDESQSPEAQTRAEELRNVEQQMPAKQAELERLRRLIAAAVDLRDQLERALQETKELEQRRDERTRELGVEQRELAALLAEANRLRTRVSELEPEPPRLQQEIDGLESELARRKNPPSAADVVVEPGGSGFDLQPTFVEVTEQGVVIYDDREPQRVRRADLNLEDGRFHALLDTVAGTPQGTIIFLIRDDAVATYRTAVNVCNTHYGADGYCPHGKLPIEGQGRIDLRRFQAM